VFILSFVDSTKDIQRLFESLKSSNLTPSIKTNRLFGKLVSIASDPKNNGIELHEDIRVILPKLHSLCSSGEYLLEEYWANRIDLSDNPTKELMSMPYEKNYRQLSRLEVMSMRIPGRTTGLNALFVGSGPLPLSAICMATEFNYTVTCMDLDRNAVNLSRRVVSALNLKNRLYTDWCQALEYPNYKDFDVVILAALVGSTSTDKQIIVEYIAKNMKPGSFLLVRSADGARELLYPKAKIITPPELKEIVKILPQNEVINSAYVYQRSSPRLQSTKYTPIERMIYA
jgi:nicotianamine synthase